MSDSDHNQLPRHLTIHQQRQSCSAASATQADWQWNSTSKKRKAEFDMEEKIQDTAEGKSDITTSANTASEESLKASEAQKQDYIHVRVRRGQATDSHSLAERARREKHNKKMKCLQDLVPGCNKVTGKAGMLDEIINYVHSLQKQVEFLSTKLAATKPRIEFSIDNFFTKEIPAYIASLPPSQLEYQYNPMHLGSSNCTAKVGMDQISSCLPIPEVFLHSSCISQLQQLSDWENIFPAGFQ